MDFYKLVEFCQVRAIQAALDPSMESIYRMKCRDYSERFHTPLHVVMNELDPVFVLQNLYELEFTPYSVDEELEEVLEKLYVIKDPGHIRLSDEELEDLVDNVLNKEIKRLGFKKDVVKKEEPKKEEDKKDLPKSGSLDFGSLEKLESISEFNKSNFEDQ